MVSEKKRWKFFTGQGQPDSRQSPELYNFQTCTEEEMLEQIEQTYQLIKQAHPNLESIKIISRLERPEVQDEYTRWTVEALLAEIKSRNVGRDRDSSSSSRSS